MYYYTAMAPLHAKSLGECWQNNIEEQCEMGKMQWMYILINRSYSYTY